MTTDNFDRCLAVTLEWEGGNDDDPDDPGGRTSRGILQREYDHWRTVKQLPTADVWHATDTEIRDIYRANYWELGRCAELPMGLDMVVFDCCVNAGLKQGTRFLQRALQVPGDGVLGPAQWQQLRDITISRR